MDDKYVSVDRANWSGDFVSLYLVKGWVDHKDGRAGICLSGAEIDQLISDLVDARLDYATKVLEER